MTNLIHHYYKSFYEYAEQFLRPDSHVTYAQPHDSLLRATVINVVERLMGMSEFNRLYNVTIDGVEKNGKDVWEALLEAFQFKLSYDKKQLAKIPRDKPVILVANHMFGMVDGTTLAHFGKKSRGNVRIFINQAFAVCKAPYFRQDILPIAFELDKQAALVNLNSRRAAIAHLKNNGVVAIFPSGATATAPRIFDRAVEGEWKISTAKMVQQSKATVIPIYFHGQNSFRFHLANKIGQAVRYGLVISESKRRMGETVRVEIGDPIHYEEVAHIRSRQELMRKFRLTVYALGGKDVLAKEMALLAQAEKESDSEDEAQE